MAEVLLRARLVERGGDFPVVASAGTMVEGRNRATSTAVEVLSSSGIDLSEHMSSPLTAGLVVGADLIVVMTRLHEATICTLDPTARSRTFLVGEVVRLGGQVGPRGDRSLVDWIRSLDGARGGHFTAGRVADELADPLGEPEDSYKRCADRLDGICTRLASLVI